MQIWLNCGLKSPATVTYKWFNDRHQSQACGSQRRDAILFCNIHTNITYFNYNIWTTVVETSSHNIPVYLFLINFSFLHLDGEIGLAFQPEMHGINLKMI